MGSQSWLVILSVAFFATLINGFNFTTEPNLIHDHDLKIDTKLPLASNPKFNKMPPLDFSQHIDAISDHPPSAATNEVTDNHLPSTKTAPPTSPKKPVATVTSDDTRTNKIPPETKVLKDVATEASKKDEEDDDYYDNEYYSDYYDDENNGTTVLHDTNNKFEGKLKPIKGDDKDQPPSNEELDDDEVADDEDEDDDDDDDDDEEEEPITNEKEQCPRDCICARNVNNYLFATCSRLDVDVQKFGSGITDLVVVNVEPKYPILLGPEFFVKVGLKHISSIKIANCTIEYIHPTAFHGLDELFAVNLTNVGISSINPDTFAENSKLRILTISGNDLSIMSRQDSPFNRYMIKAPSVEEFDISNNNLREILPTAFSELSNVVYINLSRNKLKTLPETLFDRAETIEELDLSFNSIGSLPEKIFNRTALAILNLKYNEITNDLRFGSPDLQQLDLSYCAIRHINHHLFNKMQGLTNLNLKGNQIKKIQPDSFLALRNLRHVDLSFNDIDQVSSLMFFKNTDLLTIRLNDNPKLTQLPPDGFQSQSGSFPVYLFDVSNCAIGPLGFNTFSTMPRMTTLLMSWNNINNVERGTFSFLDKLISLDLSNNLITKLDDLTFLHNHELVRLNLAGNPIKKLSAKLFLPTTKLKDLDVSECELHTLLVDNDIRTDSIKFFDSLQAFNASRNQIKKISKFDVQAFKNLHTLDISNNPLKCNEDFRAMIKWISKKNIVSGKVNENAEINTSLDVVVVPTVSQGWDELSRSVCKKNQISKSAEGIVDKEPVYIKQTYIKEQKDKKPLPQIVHEKQDLEEDTSLNEGEEDDDVDENEDEFDDDDYDEDENDEEIEINDSEPLKDKGLFVDEVRVIQETEDKILRGKLLPEENIIVEKGTIYYTSYRFVWPMLIVISSVIVLLLVIGKFVNVIMRKRGERYRQALLASKNSIVYQKLSEDVGPQTPKVHRYTKIEQV